MPVKTGIQFFWPWIPAFRGDERSVYRLYSFFCPFALFAAALPLPGLPATRT